MGVRPIAYNPMPVEIQYLLRTGAVGETLMDEDFGTVLGGVNKPYSAVVAMDAQVAYHKHNRQYPAFSGNVQEGDGHLTFTTNYLLSQGLNPQSDAIVVNTTKNYYAPAGKQFDGTEGNGLLDLGESGIVNVVSMDFVMGAESKSILIESVDPFGQVTGVIYTQLNFTNVLLTIPPFALPAGNLIKVTFTNATSAIEMSIVYASHENAPQIRTGDKIVKIAGTTVDYKIIGIEPRGHLASDGNTPNHWLVFFETDKENKPKVV